jgi:FkbM family methyltransferase
MASAKQDEWIAAQFPDDYLGWAVDAGAGDGVFQSNTMLLEDRGWNVMCIEADYRNAHRLKNARRFFAMCAINDTGGEWATFHVAELPSPSEQSLKPRYQTLTHQLKVPTMTLDQLLHIFDFPQLDVLCMDIEGGEMDALKGIDLKKWTPKVIVAEDWYGRDWLDVYLEPFGYRFVQQLEFDRCFLRG